MKTTTLLFLLFTAFSVIAQDKFFTNTGTINFEASVPLYEEVKAVNRQVAILLEPKTSTFICTVVIKDFRFKLNLMQEHFNENYMESDRYPLSEFKGKVENADKLTKDGSYTLNVTGTLQIHGVTKPYNTKAAFIVKDGTLKAVTSFQVRLADHKISIPSIVGKKIAEVVKITVDATYKP